jgi:hypothetical protein
MIGSISELGDPWNHYKVQAWAGKADWTVTNVPYTSAFSASCDYYGWSGLPTSDILGTSIWENVTAATVKQNLFTHLQSDSETNGGRRMSFVATNTTDMPNLSPRFFEKSGAPYAEQYTYRTGRGYIMQGQPRVVYRWDGTNGFKYK